MADVLKICFRDVEMKSGMRLEKGAKDKLPTSEVKEDFPVYTYTGKLLEG